MKVYLLFFLTCLGFLFFVPKEIFAHSKVVVIEMTAWGFQPQFVTLDNNSTVIFINKDSKAHWPASDVHPTHDLYPEFDPEKGVEAGQSWPFRPKKVGGWRFHDHLFPHFNGTLTVVSENGIVTQTNENWIDSFKKTVGNFFTGILHNFRMGKVQALSKESFIKLSSQEQIKNIQALSDSIGSKKAWGYIKETYKGQSGSSGNIHDLAHLAGSLIYDQLGFEGIRSCSPEFGFGCFHGFLDKAFAKSIDKLQDAHDACAKLDRTLSGPVASCIHGIGHGVASFYSVSDLNKALSTCRRLTSGSEYCFDGVFMEFVRSAPEGFYKKDDPLYPCNSLEKEFGYAYSSACGRNQPALLMGRFKLGFEEVTQICLNSDSIPFKQSCFDSLGFSLASTGNIDQITSGCQKISDKQFVIRCIKAAAGELVFQDVPNWDEKSKAVCNSLPETTECLSYVERLVTDYHRIRQ